MTLHLVSLSPFSSNSLSECLQLANNQQEAVLLLSDACYALCHPLAQTIETQTVYALESDVIERGLQAGSSVTLIDYDHFVRLTESHKNICSWG